MISVQEAQRRLVQWDLEPVKQYCIRKGVYPNGERLDRIEVEYRRFIAMCATEKVITMSKEIDDFWHVHILFSDDYTAMCHWLGMQYIHHNPCQSDGEVDALADGYHDTLRFYEEQFGEKPDGDLWPVYGQICCGSGNGCNAFPKNKQLQAML